TLLGSRGFVPAKYSCKLLKPSPSASAAASAGSVGLKPLIISQSFGIPSLSKSFEVIVAPGFGARPIQFTGSLPYSEGLIFWSEWPPPLAEAGHGATGP